MNLTTFEFSKIFEGTSIRFINSLKSYGLMDDNVINFRKKEVKRLLYHHIIKDVKILLQQFSVEKRVVLVEPSLFPNTLEICNYCDTEKLKKAVTTCLYYLKTPYYDKLVFLDKELSEYNEDIVAILMSMCNNYKKLSYQKLKRFSENNELREVYDSLKNQAL